MIIDERRSSRFRKEVQLPDCCSAPDPTGPDEANAALNRLLVAEALARLSPAQRDVIQRSYYLGWTTAQIADDLHIAEGTVKSRAHHALRVLRLALQDLA